jgi:hypothetical protein
LVGGRWWEVLGVLGVLGVVEAVGRRRVLSVVERVRVRGVDWCWEVLLKVLLV